MPPSPIDFEKLLRFFRELFAHATTLQELISTTDESLTYEKLRPTYDRQAAAEFEIFFRALNDPQAFAKAVEEIDAALAFGFRIACDPPCSTTLPSGLIGP
jgi:hypothetical protein